MKAEKLANILKSNPVLLEKNFESSVAKWNRLFKIAEKLFANAYSKEAAAWISSEMKS